jgi:hypothetical protein
MQIAGNSRNTFGLDFHRDLDDFGARVARGGDPAPVQREPVA